MTRQLNHVRLGAAMIVVGVVLGLVAGFSFARSSGAAAEEAQQRLDLLDQYVARWDIETAALEIIAVRIVDDAGIERGDATLGDDAATRLADARRRLDDLAAAGVQLAEVSAASIDGAALDAGVDADLFSLWDASFYIRWPMPLDEPSTRIEALHELAFVRTLPLHIVVETLPLIYEQAGITPSEQTAEFTEEVADTVREDPSWITPGVTPLLDESLWFSVDAARSEFPDELEHMENWYRGDPLLDFDAWSNDQSAPLPALDPAAALAAATALGDDVQMLLDQLVEAEAARDRAAVAAAESQVTTWRIATMIAMLLSAASLVVGTAVLVRRARQSSKQLSMLASTDALTGVGTRHELESRTQRLLADRSREHHAVVIIDLDRFKMVNDLHGHAAGDAVLETVGAGLRALADEVAGDDVETTVVRLGGDEFLVSLHGREPLDLHDLRRRLDHLRSSAVDVGGSTLPIEFSVGLAAGSGSPVLGDLMAEADLQVYEEKAARATRRALQRTMGTDPTAVV